MSDVMGKLTFVVMVVLIFLFMDWHARYVFLARGYPGRYGHGKSFNRAKKHYKANWSFWQRMLWVPLFKEKYEADFMLFAYFSYAHILITIVEIVILISCNMEIKESNHLFGYSYGVYGGLSILRFCFSNAKGRGII